MNDCERLKLLTNIVIQYTFLFLLIQQINFSTKCKLIINNVEIFTCKLVLFKKPNNDFINHDFSAEREISIN